MAMTGKEYGSKPAFPSSRVEEEVRAKIAYNEGVTKRDVFAAFALQGLLANQGDDFRGNAINNSTPAAVSDLSVEFADALCDALAKDGAA